MINVVISNPHFYTKHSIKALRLTLRSIEDRFKFDYRLHLIGSNSGVCNESEVSILERGDIISDDSAGFNVNSNNLFKTSKYIKDDFLFVPSGTIFLQDITNLYDFEHPYICSKKCSDVLLMDELTDSILKYKQNVEPIIISGYGAYIFNGRDAYELNYKAYYSNNMYNYIKIYYSYLHNKIKDKRKKDVTELKQYGAETKEIEGDLMCKVKKKNMVSLYVKPNMFKDDNYVAPNEYLYIDKCKYEC